MSKRILIIDDNPMSVETMFSLLLDEGFDVCAAYNGERGFKTALSYLPDAIVLDVLLPGWSGIETYEQIKSEPILAHIPVIFITVDLDVVRNQSLDIQDIPILYKPIKGEDLVAQVKAVLSMDDKQGNGSDS